MTARTASSARGATRETTSTSTGAFRVKGAIRLEEDRVFADGRREAVRRSDDHRYRPTERPYYRAAEARRAPVWTEPYEFYAGGGLGITCAAPVFDVLGGVRGVFTVDFSLDRLATAFKDLKVSSRGRVFVATAQGALKGVRDEVVVYCLRKVATDARERKEADLIRN